MLKQRRGLTRLVGAVVAASLISLGTAVEASGATDPTLSVSRTTATPGETIQYSGTGWTECGTVTVTLNTGTVIAVDTPVDGAISGSFVEWSDGMYTLTATPASSSSSCSPQDATFRVDTPGLGISLPGTETSEVVVPGQAMGYSAVGWEACGVVTVTLGTTTVATFPAGSPGFSGHFAAPSTLGNYDLTATGSSASPGCQLSAGFNVVAPPALSVSPAVASPGETIQFTTTMPYCGPVDVLLGGTLIASTFPQGTMAISGHFTAPSTFGVQSVTSRGEWLHGFNLPNPSLCLASTEFAIVAAPTNTGASGEAETGPGENQSVPPTAATPKSASAPIAPEAAPAPVSSSPRHVTG